MEEEISLFAPSKKAKKSSSTINTSENTITDDVVVKDISSIGQEEELKASFESLGLDKWQLETLQGLSIRRPTSVQVSCIPKILAGNDVSASAKTGSGKTAAFTLPILKILSEDPYGIFALILTPTRYECNFCSISSFYFGIESLLCKLLNRSKYSVVP